jgi:hypothetical protein
MVVTLCISVQYLWKYGFAKYSDKLHAPCTFTISIIILTFHTLLGLPSCYFTTGFPTKLLCHFSHLNPMSNLPLCSHPINHNGCAVLHIRFLIMHLLLLPQYFMFLVSQCFRSTLYSVHTAVTAVWCVRDSEADDKFVNSCITCYTILLLQVALT